MNAAGRLSISREEIEAYGWDEERPRGRVGGTSACGVETGHQWSYANMYVLYSNMEVVPDRQ